MKRKQSKVSMEESRIEALIEKLKDASENDAYKYSDELANIGEEVIPVLLPYLEHEDQDIKYLAARTLGQIENNQTALEPLLDAIENKNNLDPNAGMAEALLEFDCSQYFVRILKLYLYGGFKSSAMAKLILDYTEFDITPRVIKKAEKNWHHYLHNVKHDLNFDAKKEEVEDILGDLKELFAEELTQMKNDSKEAKD